MLDNWDISCTEAKLKTIENNMNSYKQLQRDEMARTVGSFEDEVAEKKRVFESVRLELKAAYSKRT